MSSLIAKANVPQLPPGSNRCPRCRKGGGEQRGGSGWLKLLWGGGAVLAPRAPGVLRETPRTLGGSPGSPPAPLAAPGLRLPLGIRRQAGREAEGGSRSTPQPTAYFFRSVPERGRWDEPSATAAPPLVLLLLLLLQHMGSKNFLSSSAGSPRQPPAASRAGPRGGSQLKDAALLGQRRSPALLSPGR